jgi:exodeoxyribonuclease VII large subunit
VNEGDVPGRKKRDPIPQLDLFGAERAPEAEPRPPRSERKRRAAARDGAPESSGPGSKGGPPDPAAAPGSAPTAPSSDERLVPAPAAGQTAPSSDDGSVPAPAAGSGQTAPSSDDRSVPAPAAGSAPAVPGGPDREAPLAAPARPDRSPGGNGPPAALPAARSPGSLAAVELPPPPAPIELPSRPARGEILTVSALAERLRGLLEKTYPFVMVRGEISNLRQPGSGHLYFSLKDEGASVRAVLFRGQARLLRFRPENGQEVVVRGRVSFYEASGDAQLICDFLEPVGAGALAVAFEQLKKKLAAEGLFDPARKRPLPFLPRRIGVVTSPSGAAIRDFLRVLHRRFPGIPVLVAPARVQGDGAAVEVARGIARLSARDDLDVIVVTRGGGSIEDLWAFNEEPVARAIAASRHPVVSAVGHEVDFTIADFVADFRAPTPTAAAEHLAPVEDDLRASLAVARGRLQKAALRALESRAAEVHRLRARLGDPRRRLADGRLGLDDRRRRAGAAARRTLGALRAALRESTRRLRAAHPVTALKLRRRDVGGLDERLRRAAVADLAARRARLDDLRARLLRAGPRDRILREGGRLADLATRLGAGVQRDGDRRRSALSDLQARLQALSPLRVLARGYAIAFRASGAVLLRAADAAPGERLHLEVADGALEVEVVAEVPPRKEKD